MPWSAPLNACIARLTELHDFPDKKRTTRSYSHEIETLVETANRKIKRDDAARADPVLMSPWTTAKRGTSEARSEIWTEAEARELLTAINHPAHGFPQWIMMHW